ncbi:hypothetical protein [Bradyrhizobium guangdongense]|uniref:hypothetical protein n=1 Tax=Bradyrhizobium guangdongense TaxID=1325090 RepID=UPI001319E2C0|nr:hypothetical protein [Bradyrhizobium guangdongense]
MGAVTIIAASTFAFVGLAQQEQSRMTDMSTMSTRMMVVTGIYLLAIVIFALLGMAASLKYLRS